MSDTKKQASGRRAAPAEDLADLYENAPCGYLSLDPEGFIIKTNATFSRWTGLDSDAILGRRFRDLLHITGRIYYETHLAPLLRIQGFANEVALDLVLENDARLPVLVNAVEGRDADGNVLSVRMTLFNATDRRRYERELLDARGAADAANAELRKLNATLELRVTEAVSLRMEAEESLRQSQKMEAVGQLTGGMAHDFNNLLGAIMGSVDLIGISVQREDFDAIPRYVEAARDTGKRAAVLTHRLLAFSRHQKLEPKAVDINRLIAGMDDLIRRTVGPDTRLEVIGAGGVWPTMIDPHQLENALLNLCINARDAMPDGGRLTIETANKWLDRQGAKERELAPGQYVSVAVTDTGTGMSPDVSARAFDPFFTTKPIGAGTGLGLSMVYGFARQSGGQVRIYSEVGQGTTMCIYLPRYRGEVEESVGSAMPPALKGTAAAGTVLVVDDELAMRMLITEVLKGGGYNVIEASEGPTALKVLQATPSIDMLITDVGLPGGMNGRQVADAAREVHPKLKVLFITGYAEHAAVRHGHLGHDMHLLTKPFAIEALIAKVAELLP